MPEALFYSYLVTRDEKYLKIAKSTLEFLSSITFQDEIFSPIGHDGWYFRNGKKAHFDQQPVDAASTIQTFFLANNVTKEKKYVKNAFDAYHWFLGKNILNQMVYDESTASLHLVVGF